jgi:hypothetical protein
MAADEVPPSHTLLTLKVIDTVGSSTLMVGSALGASLLQMVSPICGDARREQKGAQFKQTPRAL